MGIRVLVADDSPLVREGVRAMLAEQPDIDLVALAADLPGLMAAATAERSTWWSRTSACRRRTPTRGSGPRSSCTVAFPTPAWSCSASTTIPPTRPRSSPTRVARRAYLLKERLAQPGQLCDAVRAVAGGGSVIDPRIVEAMLSSRRHHSALDELTRREREVLAEMATGANNQQIAGRLFVTVRAVERRINSMFAKLGLVDDKDGHRRVQAVLLYLAEGR